MLRNTLEKAASCGCVRAEKAQGYMPNLTGQKFGHWTVLHKAPLSQPGTNGVQTGWLCRCDCGEERVLQTRLLTCGESSSCGCAARENAKERISDTVQHFDHTTISLLRRKTPNANSKTGVRGVYWSNREQCYIAKIGFKGKSITLGRFSSLAKATEIRRQAEMKLFDPIIEEYDALKNENEENSHE